MQRNNTSFNLLITAKLKQLYAEYKSDPDLPKYLKYYQYLPQMILETVDSRGLLIYDSPGMGKTRIAVASAAKFQKVVLLAPQGLHNNFRGEMKKWEELTGQKIKLGFVSSNAYNSADQFEGFNIDNSFLIVDEAHIFFKSIINSSTQTNARRIYDLIMAAKNIKILFLTGTPVSKNPFELVPCFNMLAGYDLMPTSYETFCRLYVKDGMLINKNKFQNRILGLVSHVDSIKPSDFETPPKSDSKFPDDLGITVERVEMGEEQYRQYLLYRYKEDAENKRAGFKESTKPLSLPNSEKQNAKTYYVFSRMCSNFMKPIGAGLIQDLDNSAFTPETGPKMHLIASRMSLCKGKSIAYSQFVENGLNPLGRYLEFLGYELFDADNYTGGKEDDIDDCFKDDLLRNTKINSKYITYDGHDKLKRTGAQKHVKFAKHLCTYAKFVDDAYTPEERNLIQKLISTNQTIQRWYDDKFPIPKGFKYRANKMQLSKSIHHGQRKLFMSELQFLTESRSDLTKTILYAGSATGYHLIYLSELFPEMHFILYDPAKFCEEVHKSPKFEIHNEFFTDEVAAKYAEAVDYFISDIRVGTYDDVGQGWTQEFEDQVGVDMKAQMKWTQIIKPKIASLLKFRPPYIDKPMKMKYLSGRIMLQTWPSKSSTETRLLTTKADSDNYTKLMELDVWHYQNFMSYHNTIIREWVTFDLGLDGKSFNVPGFDRCFDCANEFMSWKDYLKDSSELYKIAGLMNGFTRRVYQPLDSHKTAHYYQSNLPVCEKRERMYKMFVGGVENGRYAIISGAVDANIRERIIEVFNSDENKYGAIIKCILMSEVGSAGLDLKAVLETHQIEPYWENTREKQFRFRAIRLGSHDQLPPEDRRVKSYIYLSVPNSKIYDQMIEREPKTIDEIFYERALKQGNINEQFTKALEGAALECTLFGYGDCRACAATNEELFNLDAAADVAMADKCAKICEKSIEVKKITYKDKDYYYNSDGVYEFSEQFGGYVPCDPTDDIFVDEDFLALTDFKM